MNILVTGGAGGIGSTLCFLLNKNGYKTIAYDNLNNGYIENLNGKDHNLCEFVFGDIRNRYYLKSVLRENRIDAIVHLAALTSLPDRKSTRLNSSH